MNRVITSQIIAYDHTERASLFFVVATLMPAFFIIAGLFFGAYWSAAALISVSALVYCLDYFIAPETNSESAEFPVGPTFSVMLGLVHFPVFVLSVYGLSSGLPANVGSWVALYIATGFWLGQVSNSNAHELIHRTSYWPRKIGIFVFTSMLYGHHSSAHTKVHHVWAATDRDPNSAKRGETFWHFYPRAWFGAFLAGLRAETQLREKNKPEIFLHHPYVIYIGGALALMIITAFAGGIRALAVYVGLSLFAQIQILLADYVQHYGLRRKIYDDGKPEPMGPNHSWNTPHFYSSKMMMNAPRHSQHHVRPAIDFSNLDPVAKIGSATILPYSLPIMSTLALIPFVFRQVMRPPLESLEALR